MKESRSSLPVGSSVPNNSWQLSASRLPRILGQALEEILGSNQLDALLGASGPTPESGIDRRPDGMRLQAASDSTPLAAIGGLADSLEAAYGPQVGRGLAQRIGQACFRLGLREFGNQVGVNEMNFRLLPLQSRLRRGLDSLASLFNSRGHQHIRLEQTDKGLFWRVNHCPLCDQRHSTEPVCYMAVGLLQEALYWLSGGRLYRVDEIECVSQGDSACRFFIHQSPIEQ